MIFLRLPLRILSLLLCALWFTASQANDHGGGGGGGNAPLKFTTNLGNGKYVLFDLVLETAGPEADQALNALKPMLQHRVLLLLSGETVETLMPLEGKIKLQEKIRDMANKLIGEKPKTGVKDALFTNFIIQ